MREEIVDPEIDLEALAFLFSQYHEAKAAYSVLFHNPPAADAQGNWPRNYVGDLTRAQAAVDARLRELGSWIVRNEDNYNLNKSI